MNTNIEIYLLSVPNKVINILTFTGFRYKYKYICNGHVIFGII